MEITVQTLFNSVDDLILLSTKPLKVKVAYDIRKRIKIIQEQLNIWQELIQSEIKPINDEFSSEKEKDEFKILSEEDKKKKEEDNEKIISDKIKIINDTKFNLDILPIKLDELGDIEFKSSIIFDYLIVE